MQIISSAFYGAVELCCRMKPWFTF